MSSVCRGARGRAQPLKFKPKPSGSYQEELTWSFDDFFQAVQLTGVCGYCLSKEQSAACVNCGAPIKTTDEILKGGWP